ncbi:MAG: NCS2 family permease [Lutispora sp.]|nr:NCS2 family permease [Lutispora sp.]MDD4834991.1 NCS2 family permease [Lutispora sp.]
MEKYFKLKENNTTVKTEVIAGITTFVTMAYIIFVNPSILRMAGMNAAGALGDGALPFNAFNDPVVGSVMAATCISAAIGTLIMGLYANYPFAQAPGMGLNAFFAFSVVLGMSYTWQQALAAVFISGLVFILITLTKIREMIIDSIPMSLKHAVSGGIGLFIALIGLKNAGIIVANPATLVGFGDLTAPATLLAIFGLMLTAILMSRNIKGSMLLGILATTLVGIFTGVVAIPEGFSLVSAPPSLSHTFMKMDFAGLLKVGEGATLATAITGILTVILSFSFVDMFDTIGTLVGTASKANMMDKDGKLPRVNKALMADAIATSAGAMLGTSTVTTYVESAAGVLEGGRTGLTSVVTSALFILALFFAPLVGLVPAEATAPALIIVGVLMMGALKEINFNDFTVAFPAFLTVVMMPFTYSIANGIASGMIAYPIVKVATGKHKEVHPVVYILAALFILRFATMAG